jgi:hypothetical protein
MKQRILYILTFLFLFLQISAQEAGKKGDLILLHGMVMDAETMQAVANAQYLINNRPGGVSDEEGKFSLYIYRGDTITFTFLGYRDVILSTDSLPGVSYVAGVFLQTDTLQIGEVIVLPRMADLRSEFKNTKPVVSQEMINAQNNITISAYQGVNSAARLGDPNSNYELLKQQQSVEAYEKGGIPSDKLVGLNMISILPAAIYLLSNGLPEKPPPPKPHISASELEKMKKAYKEKLRAKQ